MVIAQTPHRISFFGGGTDYPVWFREHGGAVLATSIDKYIYTNCRVLPPFHEYKHRIIYSKMESVKSTAEIVHPAVREAFRFLGVTDGIELHHDTDLPARSGVGSSSSFVVGLLNALYALRGEVVDKSRLAREAIHLEQAILKENVGCQDQIMAAYGGFNVVRFHPSGDFTVQPLTVGRARLDELQSHLMLFFTGVHRFSSDIAGEQVKNTPKRASELHAIGGMVDEGVKLLTGRGPIADFGRLLHEGWQMKRQLSSKIATPAIDEIYRAGLSAGAIGGKILGAGGGGFMLFFVPPEKQSAVRLRLGGLVEVKFAFENHGTNLIFYRSAAA